MACGISVPQPGTEAAHPASEAQVLNHWTARDIPPHRLWWSYFAEADFSVHRIIPVRLEVLQNEEIIQWVNEWKTHSSIFLDNNFEIAMHIKV